MSSPAPATPARSSCEWRKLSNHRHSQSAPTLHHRGEHSFGTVRGFEQSLDQYVPRAMWTQTEGSPLKRPEFNAEDYHAQGRAADMQKNFMQQHVRSALDQQLQEKEARNRQQAEETKNMMRTANIDMARTVKEDNMDMEGVNNNRKVFRAGLDEQMAQNAQRAHENRLAEASEAAELKLRATQQLCQELSKDKRKKEALKKDMKEQLQKAEVKKQQQRAEQQSELLQVRQSMRNQLQHDMGCWGSSLQRINAAAQQREANCSHYAKSTGKIEVEKQAQEDRKLEREERHQQRRMDLHFARRDIGRARQQQRVVQELEQQVAQKERQKGMKRFQQDLERQQVLQATRTAMESDFIQLHKKRAEELDHQAALIVQMYDNQQRRADDNGSIIHSRCAPAMKVMDVTPGLLSIADARRSGQASQQSDPPDHMQRMDASRYLQKPCGKAEEVKPWVDDVRSHGPGDTVGVLAGNGPTRSKLMSSGGPANILRKSMEQATKEKQWSGNWYDGLSPADLRAGKQASERRRDAAVADKAIA